MIRTAPLWTRFYESLAFLFYGLTYRDGEVRKEEIALVKKLIQEVWLDLEPSLDEYGYDAAYQIEAVFDWLFEMRPTHLWAVKKFERFVHEHPGFVDDKLAQQIWESANRIAAACAGKNKSELTYLYQLQEILKLSLNGRSDVH